MKPQRASAIAASALALALASVLGACSDSDDDGGASGLARTLQLTPSGDARSCTDAKLSLTFARPPTIGTSGAIRVFRDDGTPVDAIDLATLDRTANSPLFNSGKRAFGGALSDNGTLHQFNYYPILVDGNTASIHLHAALAYGRTYYVTIDPGVFDDGQGFAGIADTRAWRFTTKASAPAAGSADLSVAADGSGDFCSVQGAIDFVPAGNTRQVTINVRKGTYDEIVYVLPTKPFITVRGEDRDATVIRYANSDRFNVATASTADNQCIQRRIPGTPDLYNCWRAMFGVEASDFTLQDITLRNTTPADGSQAEAFRGNNQRIVLERVNLYSLQDTLRLQMGGYVTHSDIEGDVDFTWGTGPVYFRFNELKALRAGYYSMVRNDASVHGNVYVANRLTRAASLGNATVYLSRIEPLRFPASEAVFIDSAMDAHVLPVAWQVNGTGVTCAQAGGIHFWEYGSTDLAGRPVDTSQRLACSRQMTAAEAAQYRDPAFVLGGWVPTTVDATPAGAPPGLTTAAQAPGATLAVAWSAPAGHLQDLIGLYRAGDPDTAAPLAEQATTTATTGTTTFTLPTAPGRYELRYFLHGGRVRTASSNVVTVQ